MGAQVLDLCSRLAKPHWMRRPEEWFWKTTDGRVQGFGHLWQTSPGLANLLWLTLDSDTPPTEPYDSAHNALYVAIIMGAESAKLNGEPLLDQAGILPLAKFHDALPERPAGGTRLERALPLLKMLAGRRLGYVFN